MDAAHRTRKWLRFTAVVVLSSLPLLYLVHMVQRFAFVFPYYDQWAFVPKLRLSYQGQLTWHALFEPHMEHRILFPQLIFLGLAHLTHWNIRYEITVNLILGIVIFLIHVRLVTVTGRRSGVGPFDGLIPVVAYFLFSFVQSENWVWGWQLSLLLSVATFTGGVAVLALDSRPWRRLLVGSCLGIISSFSFANGLLFWPIATGMLLFLSYPRGRTRVIHVGLFGVLGGVVTYLYLHGLERPPESSGVGYATRHLSQYAAYVLKYVGSPMNALDPLGRAAAVAGVLGITGFVALVGYLTLVRRFSFRVLLPYVALALYSILSGSLTGIGRLSHTSAQALSSRYTTIMMPFWIAMIVFLVLYGRSSMGSGVWRYFRKTVSYGMVGVLMVLLTLSTYHDLGEREFYYIRGTNAMNAFLAGGFTERQLEGLYPDPRLVLLCSPWLVTHGMTIFHVPPGGRARDPASIDRARARILTNTGAALLRRPHDAMCKTVGLQALDEATTLDPNDAAAHMLLGISMLADGKLEPASLHFIRASMIEPKQPRAHVYLALVAATRGKRAAAKREFIKALTLAPQDFLAHADYAVFLARQGEKAEALKQMQAAVRARPNDQRTRNLLKRMEQAAGAGS